MKIFEWNIGMAATIPSNSNRRLNGWIVDEITKGGPDCIVLTEFVVSPGIDYFIGKLEELNYHWFISNSTKENGILIALKKDTFDFKNTFDYKKNTVIKSEALAGTNLPDFYEIQVKWNKRILSIIGARIKVRLETEGKKAFTKDQFDALDEYLNNISHDVICIGDFNAFWGNRWNTNENTTLPNVSNKYYLFTPKYKKDDWWSYVQPNGSKVQLDHMITNINLAHVDVVYDWNFISNPMYGSNIKKETPNKIKGLPDHAILKVIW